MGLEAILTLCEAAAVRDGICICIDVGRERLRVDVEFDCVDCVSERFGRPTI
jgi:hypothetical protein